MKATVFQEKKGVYQVGIGKFTQRVPTDGFFWLDMDGASAEEIQTVTAALRIPEPTSSWLPRFGQRARFEVDANIRQVRMSTFAVGVSGLPTEGHFLYTRSWLLTVHAGADASMDRARAMCRVLTEKITSNHVAVVLIILTEFMASFDPLLEHTDELLGELEDQVLRVPKAAKLQQLAVLRKQMWSLHRLWEPQYERIRNFALAIAGLPELSNEAQSFNDYAERISDLIDKINDLRQRAERRYGELWDECLQQAVTSHEPFDDHLRYLSAADLSDRLPRDEFSMDD